MADGDTTYICVADGDGMMVSLIQSVSVAFGSGVVAGDTGVLLNDRAGRGFSLADGDPNVYAPGKRTMHTLNCWLVTDDDGAPVVAGGTPGGDGQPQWNLQMLSGLIDQGLDVQHAVEAPRWDIWPGTDPQTAPAVRAGRRKADRRRRAQGARAARPPGAADRRVGVRRRCAGHRARSEDRRAHRRLRPPRRRDGDRALGRGLTRVIVLGCAGSGKSTFARRLGERTGAPVIDLDAIWRGDEDHLRFRETLSRLHAADAWISDGNFALATFDIRLPRADLIVWLDRGRPLCAWRALKRVLTPGEPHHKLRDLGHVLAFIRNFDRVNRPRIEAERERLGPAVPVVHLASDREVEAFVDRA